MNAKFVESKWYVTSVCIDHNHGLSPNKATYFKGYRNLDFIIKRKLEVNDRAEISGSSYEPTPPYQALVVASSICNESMDSVKNDKVHSPLVVRDKGRPSIKNKTKSGCIFFFPIGFIYAY